MGATRYARLNRLGTKVVYGPVLVGQTVVSVICLRDNNLRKQTTKNDGPHHRTSSGIFEPNMRLLLPTALLVPSALLLPAQDGAALYQRNCASCHDGTMDRAPARDSLKGMSAERVLAAMESGPMITMAVRLSAAERRTL